jgi:hypothetical protein
MKVTLDLKALVAIFSAVAVLSGFYYTTLHRLDTLEASIESINNDVQQCKKDIKVVRRSLKKARN